MEVLDQRTQQHSEKVAEAGAIALDPSGPTGAGSQSTGSSILDSSFNEAISQTMSDLDLSQAKPVAANASATGSLETDPNPTKAAPQTMGTCQFAGTSLCTCNQSKSTPSETGTSGSTSGSVLDPSTITPTSTASGTTSTVDDHNHAPDVSGNKSTHIAVEGLQPTKNLDATKITRSSTEKLLTRALSNQGDILDSRGGANDVVIAGRGNDIIFGDLGGTNTITTGTGRDSIVFGRETTNRIFDFDPAKDRILLADGLTTNDIMIVQGQNPGKGGLNQPLDSNNNALIIDKASGHILGALTFVKAESLSEQNFGTIANEDLEVFREDGSLKRLFKEQKGDGQLNATKGRDKLMGGEANDFLYVGDDGFRINRARGIDEFPFPTDSPGTSEVRAELKGGVLRVDGKYKNFDGLPLFSQGERTIDPNAKILNGANPQALIDGFLKVPQDVEGNPISGTHLHFSPAGDSRGNFADATVVRFFENTPKDAKSGTFKGEFELSPEEQAALLAGNLYINLHTNIDGDKDGRAGFPTGENRINLNKDVIRFV